MMRLLTNIRADLSRFTSSEGWFFLFAVICSFCICFGYAVVRPISDAVFITQYGSHFLPYAWLAVIPLNMIVVSFYNKSWARYGCWITFLGAISAIVLMNLIAAFFLKKSSILPFIFYAWKEVYVVLLFQLLWSVIHSTFSLQKAKYVYGLMFAVGGTGGLLGSLLPGFFAVAIGSENLLYAAFPCFIILTLAYRKLLKHTSSVQDAPRNSETASFREGWRMIFNSRTLSFILVIVILMQLVSTLAYYQFNMMLESVVGDKDLRTEYIGKVSGLVNVLSVSLQLVGSFVLVHFLGLRKSHMLVPAMLGSNAAMILMYPSFSLVAMGYIANKACDFSIFGIIKEMLYIPLSQKEKFQAKAVIDVFAYRTAKSLGSFLILGLQVLQGSSTLRTLSIGLILLFMLWIWIVHRFLENPQENRC